MAGVAQVGNVEAGQVWEIDRGANKKAQLYEVISVSGSECTGFGGFQGGRRVYLRHHKTRRMINKSLDALIRGIGCRRVS